MWMVVVDFLVHLLVHFQEIMTKQAFIHMDWKDP
jgi:hypothetical protein